MGGLGDADYVRGRMISAQAHYERCLALCREHGLGRIEAAHRQMLGLTRFFGNDVRGALADALAAAEAARHIGQPRGEMVAHMIAAEMHANLMMLDEAMAQLDAVERLIGQLGAARFEPLAPQLPRQDPACHGTPGRGAAAAAPLGRGQPRDLARLQRSVGTWAPWR